MPEWWVLGRAGWNDSTYVARGRVVRNVRAYVVWRTSLLARCRQNNISSTVPVLHTLMCESAGNDRGETLEDFGWFMDHFPETVEMRHSVHAFKFVSEQPVV